MSNELAVVGSAVAAWRPSALAAMPEEEFNQRVQFAVLERKRLKEVQHAVMTEGEDYGVIPGTKKPTLLKPGSETLNRMAGLVPTYTWERILGDGKTTPHIAYVVSCTLHEGTADGAPKAMGLGSANSWETKYRWRYADRSCPDCGKPTIRRSKDEYGGGWYCATRSGGCNAKFVAKDPRIVDQEVGLVENNDPFAVDNTLLKMARKRAQVDATLTEHAASGLFTQDVEDEDVADPDAAPGAAAAPAQPSGNASGSKRAGEVQAVQRIWAERAAKLEIPEGQRDALLGRILREKFGLKQWSQLPTGGGLLPITKYLREFIPEDLGGPISDEPPFDGNGEKAPDESSGAEGYVLTEGKYKDKAISDPEIPDAYLKRLANAEGEHAEAAVTELERRAKVAEAAEAEAQRQAQDDSAERPQDSPEGDDLDQRI